MFSLMTFITSPFQDSMSKYLPSDSLECCAVAIILGSWTCFTGPLLYFALNLSYSSLPPRLFPTAPQPTSHMPYPPTHLLTLSILLSSTSSAPFVSLAHCCQRAVTGCFLCPEQHPAAVLSPFASSNPSTRFSWHNWIKFKLDGITSSPSPFYSFFRI